VNDRLPSRLTPYRLLSLALALGFAAAGLLFLLFPGETLALGQGSVAGPMGPDRFFLVLASAYMYVVTALAWSMYRSPGEPIYPLLLFQAKGVSSVLSFGFFLFARPLPIYLANGVVDATLAVVVLLMFRGVAKTRRRCD
jgi:hypothetical protein